MIHGNKSIQLLLAKYPIADISITPTPIRKLAQSTASMLAILLID